MDLKMDDLLCDEVLDSSSDSSGAASPVAAVADGENSFFCSRIHFSQVDFNVAIENLVNKEIHHLPKPGFMDLLESNASFQRARLKAIEWFMGCQRQLNLCIGTVFLAANYFDRFISIDKCQGWNRYQFGILSIVCLHLASKLNETDPPKWHELQIEDLDLPSESTMLKRMEMTILNTLKGRLFSTTPYCYLQLIDWNNTNFTKTQQHEIMSRATHMLLRILLNPKFQEFRYSIVADRVLKYTLGECTPPKNNHSFDPFTPFILQDQMEEMARCRRMMENGLIEEAVAITETGNENENTTNEGSSVRKRKRDDARN